MRIKGKAVKRCPDCGEDKKLDEFYNNACRADGKQSVCKACSRSRSDKWDASNPDRRRRMTRMSARKRRVKNPEIDSLTMKRFRMNHPGYSNERFELYRNEYPERARACGILRKAVYKGKVVKPESCEICQKDGRLHGHHDDYSKPLEVRWVCPQCHCDIHERVINE